MTNKLRRRSRTCAAIACLLVMYMSPASAEVRVPPRSVLRAMLIRTSSAQTSFEMTVSATAYQDKPAFGGFIFARTMRGQIASTSTGLAHGILREDPEEAGVAGQRTSFCDKSNRQMQLCWSQGPGPGAAESLMYVGGSFDMPSSKGSDNVVFVVASGHSTRLDFKGRGWKVVRYPLSFRSIDASDASFAWTSVLNQGADLFFNASLSGGRFGSLAAATPPCSFYGFAGAGSLALTGGVISRSITCPTGEWPVLTAHQRKATTWIFSGYAAGSNLFARNRLFVIDMPKVIPRAAL